MLSTILQIAGLITLSLGIGLMSIPLGICAFGIACVVVGIAIEKDKS